MKLNYISLNLFRIPVRALTINYLVGLSELCNTVHSRIARFPEARLGLLNNLSSENLLRHRKCSSTTTQLVITVSLRTDKQTYHLKSLEYH